MSYHRTEGGSKRETKFKCRLPSPALPCSHQTRRWGQQKEISNNTKLDVLNSETWMIYDLISTDLTILCLRYLSIIIFNQMDANTYVKCMRNLPHAGATASALWLMPLLGPLACLAQILSLYHMRVASIVLVGDIFGSDGSPRISKLMPALPLTKIYVGR